MSKENKELAQDLQQNLFKAYQHTTPKDWPNGFSLGAFTEMVTEVGIIYLDFIEKQNGILR